MVRVLIIQIREQGAKGPGCYEYKNEIVLDNPKLLALIFEDIKTYGGSIDKAYQEFKKKADYPF